MRFWMPGVCLLLVWTVCTSLLSVLVCARGGWTREQQFKAYGCLVTNDTGKMTWQCGSIHKRLGESLCWSKETDFAVVLSPPVELEVWCSTASSGSARALWYNVAMNLEKATRIMRSIRNTHHTLHIIYLFTSCNDNISKLVYISKYWRK